MKFFTARDLSVTLSVSGIGAWVTKFVAIVGWPELKKRASTLITQFSENRFLETLLNQRHYIELWIYVYRDLQLKRGRLPSVESSPHLCAALAFAAMFARVHGVLDDAGRTRLKGRVLDGLRSGIGLLPLEHEISSVVHLLRADWSIALHDIDSTEGGFDFLAVKGGVEVEVECKNIGPDTGRKITNSDLYAFGKHLKRFWPRFAPGEARFRLVTVRVPNRLGVDSKRHAELARLVESRLTGGQLVERNGDLVDLTEFDVPRALMSRSGTNPVTDSGFRALLNSYIGEANSNCLIVFKPGAGFLGVSVKSAQPDNLLDSIFEALLDSTSRQFSKGRPAWLLVRLTDVLPEQMAALKGQEWPENPANGLQMIASRLFGRRPHLHSIMFIPGTMLIKQRGQSLIGVPRTFEPSAPTYFFRNHEHPLASNLRIQP